MDSDSSAVLLLRCRLRGETGDSGAVDKGRLTDRTKVRQKMTKATKTPIAMINPTMTIGILEGLKIPLSSDSSYP